LEHPSTEGIVKEPVKPVQADSVKDELYDRLNLPIKRIRVISLLLHSIYDRFDLPLVLGMNSLLLHYIFEKKRLKGC